MFSYYELRQLIINKYRLRMMETDQKR